MSSSRDPLACLSLGLGGPVWKRVGLGDPRGSQLKIRFCCSVIPAQQVLALPSPHAVFLKAKTQAPALCSSSPAWLWGWAVISSCMGQEWASLIQAPDLL